MPSAAMNAAIMAARRQALAKQVWLVYCLNDDDATIDTLWSQATVIAAMHLAGRRLPTSGKSRLIPKCNEHNSLHSGHFGGRGGHGAERPHDIKDQRPSGSAACVALERNTRVAVSDAWYKIIGSMNKEVRLAVGHRW